MSHIESSAPRPFESLSFDIDADREGQRIDNYLISLTKLPKSLIYNLMRNKKIKVNKKKVEPSYRIQVGDTFQIPRCYTPEYEKQAEKSRLETKPAESFNWIDKNIVYENDDFLIVNKPYGLASHGGSGQSLGLIETLRLRFPKKTFHLAHRLDRETSGLMIIPKKMNCLREINELFAQRQISKIYLAITSQTCRRKTHVESPLSIVRENGIRKSVIDYKEGVSAETVFIPLSQFLKRSLCLVIPHTGRMHQIRAHAASQDLPLLGDRLYGGAECAKMHLHACKLSFYYQNQEWTFESEPPEFWDQEFFNGWDIWKKIRTTLQTYHQQSS